MAAGLQWRKPGFKKSYIKGNIHRDRCFSRLSIVNGHKKSNNREKLFKYFAPLRTVLQMRERNWEIGKEKRKLTLPL
jgi:hypothetical protein